MAKANQSSATQKLRGKALLARLNSLEGLNKTEKAKACGYAMQDKNGKARAQIREFMNAILEAQGITLDSERSSEDRRGRSLSYRAKVQKNGILILGPGYTQEMGVSPGDRFDIRLGRSSIKLTAVDTEQTAPQEFDDTVHEDDDFDSDEIE